MPAPPRAAQLPGPNGSERNVALTDGCDCSLDYVGPELWPGRDVGAWILLIALQPPAGCVTQGKTRILSGSALFPGEGLGLVHG